MSALGLAYLLDLMRLGQFAVWPRRHSLNTQLLFPVLLARSR